MKKKLRKTGEIVDVIDWYELIPNERNDSDYVSYIDSEGNEHPKEKGLNISWDFEDIPYPEISWKNSREEAVLAIIQGILSNGSVSIKIGDSECYTTKDLVKMAINCVDILIEELKG